MKLSIVTTLYNSARYLKEFHERCVSSAEKLTSDFEIIFVNDGSPDDSLEVVLELQGRDRRVKVIDLSRNFGHHKAMMTGLAHAQGERVFLTDCDLEEAPEWLIAFAEQMEAENCDVVYGVQEKRKGSFFERFTGDVFYKVFRFLTGVNITSNIVTSRLMSQKYVRSLTQFDEREVFMAGLWEITGFNQKPHIVEKISSSDTTYSFKHKFSLLINLITSFSNKPLYWISYCGFIISILSIFFVGYLVFNWMFLARPPSGWTSILASVFLMGGLIISFMGIIAIYLSKMFSEVKRRPYTIIKHIYGQEI